LVYILESNNIIFLCELNEQHSTIGQSCAWALLPPIYCFRFVRFLEIKVVTEHGFSFAKAVLKLYAESTTHQRLNYNALCDKHYHDGVGLKYPKYGSFPMSYFYSPELDTEASRMDEFRDLTNNMNCVGAIYDTMKDDELCAIPETSALLIAYVARAILPHKRLRKCFNLPGHLV